MLEEMIVTHMTEEDMTRFGDMSFSIEPNSDEIINLMPGDALGEDAGKMFVTDMVFERRNG